MSIFESLVNSAPEDKKSYSRIPNVATRTDHSISIRAGGVTVGRIQNWGPSQTRNVEALYELNSATSGGMAEQVPSVISGLTINVTRYDLYDKKMEQIWGIGNGFLLLTDQTTPFRINERWDNPDDTVEMWTYVGCWFTSLGRTHSSQGDRITKVNATIAYTNKYQVSSSDIAGQEWASRAVNKIKRKWF
jgi:hypothetical protein